MHRKAKSEPVRRKAYAAPRLTRYGDVRVLVQAGTMGTVEGAAMTNLMRFSSDRMLKKNILRIGTHPLGIGLYLFDYKPEFRDMYGHGKQYGVMADEVESVMPAAVSVGPQRHKIVDYAMLRFQRNGA
jgi:Chaperone of endosialidase